MNWAGLRTALTISPGEYSYLRKEVVMTSFYFVEQVMVVTIL